MNVIVLVLDAEVHGPGLWSGRVEGLHVQNLTKLG